MKKRLIIVDGIGPGQIACFMSCQGPFPDIKEWLV